jgi:colanic acid/amylovoran biosynthesis glycosyltransferase
MELASKPQDKPNVIIYRNHLLRASETFIREQAGALRNFMPTYVGTRSVAGLELPERRSLVVNSGNSYGKFWEYYSQKFGFTPSFNWKAQKIKASLIHAHFAQDAAIALPLARTLKIPLVATFHGFDVTVKDPCAEKTWIQQQYFARRETLKRSAKLFIAVSHFIKQKAMEQGFPEERMVVHYIGVDARRFQALPKVERQPIVLFVGRLVEKKGCEYLIRAMERVQAQMPEMELVVIGDGPLRNPLEALAQQRLKRYRFLGVQPPDQVQAWMQRAKIFSVPSITADSGDAEGFGIVFAEAQATGLPVVSFASGGIPEAVAHEKTGFLAPEKDVDTLASYLQCLLANPMLWNAFSHQGRGRVQRQFNLDHQTGLLENIYWNQVLEAPLFWHTPLVA